MNLVLSMVELLYLVFSSDEAAKCFIQYYPGGHLSDQGFIIYSLNTGDHHQFNWSSFSDVVVLQKEGPPISAERKTVNYHVRLIEPFNFEKNMS